MILRCRALSEMTGEESDLMPSRKSCRVSCICCWMRFLTLCWVLSMNFLLGGKACRLIDHDGASAYAKVKHSCFVATVAGKVLDVKGGQIFIKRGVEIPLVEFTEVVKSVI